MTLDQIIKIQSIIDKRAIRSDTLAILDIERYSKSLGAKVRYGNIYRHSVLLRSIWIQQKKSVV